MQPDRKKDLFVAGLILLTTFVIFRISPIHNVSDSRYEMLFSQQLFWNHSFSLDPRTFPQLQTQKDALDRDNPVGLYQLKAVDGRMYHFYPPGTIVLSMPYVALANAMGISAAHPDGTFDDGGEIRIQRGLAAILMAGLSVIIFFTCRLMLPPAWSLLVTATTALGTPIWSTASRALWSHTWGIFVLGLAIWLIVRAEVTKAPLRPVLLATTLSWLYFIRPTFAPAIIVFAAYVLIYHRRIFIWFTLTGCVWLAAFVGWSEYHFHQPLPDYYRGEGFYFPIFWKALPGVLISPSRGLFIYVPILFFVGYLLVRYWRDLRHRLVAPAVVVIVWHLITISLFAGWYGGWCYGPRYCTDLVPWFALLGALGVEARLRWHSQNSPNDSVFLVTMESAVASLLIAASIVLNGIGAISASAGTYWSPLALTHQDVSRLWDWKHPQFLGVPRSWLEPNPKPAPRPDGSK